MLKYNYESVNITHCNNLSTFVPSPFFKEDKLDQYLNFNVKVLKNDFIAYDIIPNSEIVNVYVPFVHLNNYFFEKYGSFEYKHSSTVLVEALLKRNSSSGTEQFFVNVEHDFFQITIIHNKKLVFYNAFNFKTKEDFIYYILFTAEQLNLNPEVFELTLSGEIEKDSELYTIVYNYVRNVKFYSPENKYTNLSSHRSHSDFILLNQY